MNDLIHKMTEAQASSRMSGINLCDRSRGNQASEDWAKVNCARCLALKSMESR